MSGSHCMKRLPVVEDPRNGIYTSNRKFVQSGAFFHQELILAEQGCKTENDGVASRDT